MPLFLLALALTPSASADVIPLEPEPTADVVEAGPDLSALERNGCLACHSVDGSNMRGPTLAGLWGHERGIVVDGVSRLETFDGESLRVALRRPDAEKRVGFGGRMPAYTLDEAEIAEIEAALVTLGEVEAPAPTPPKGYALAMAVFAFVFGHLALSSQPVRGPIVEAMEEKGFQGLYAMLMLACFMWGIAAWISGPQQALWAAPTWTTHLPIAVMPLVFVLWVVGNTAPGPKLDALPEQGDLAHGIHRITRHPANLGYGLWAIAHLATNPELRNVLVFGGMLALALFGSLHIDRRRAHAHPEAWARYAKETSLIPFAAILTGRNRLALGELGWKKPLVGVLLFIGFLAIHPWLIGVSPLPVVGG